MIHEPRSLFSNRKKIDGYMTCPLNNASHIGLRFQRPSQKIRARQVAFLALKISYRLGPPFFHIHSFITVPWICSIKANDIGRVAVMQNLQLCHDLLANCRLDLQMDHFLGHDHPCGLMPDTMNHSSVASSQLRELFEIVIASEVAKLLFPLDEIFQTLPLLVVHIGNDNVSQMQRHFGHIWSNVSRIRGVMRMQMVQRFLLVQVWPRMAEIGCESAKPKQNKGFFFSNPEFQAVWQYSGSYSFNLENVCQKSQETRLPII